MIGKPSCWSLSFTRECFFQWKNSFFVFGQHWCRATFFQNQPAQITKSIEVMLAKWNGKLIAVSFLLNLTPLGLPHIKKGRLWNMVKSTWISKFHLTRSFQQETSEAQQGSTWRLVELFKSRNDSRHQHCGWFFVGR